MPKWAKTCFYGIAKDSTECPSTRARYMARLNILRARIDEHAVAMSDYVRLILQCDHNMILGVWTVFSPESVTQRTASDRHDTEQYPCLYHTRMGSSAYSWMNKMILTILGVWVIFSNASVTQQSRDRTDAEGYPCLLHTRMKHSRFPLACVVRWKAETKTHPRSHPALTAT